MDVITYSLKGEQSHSDQYYQDIAGFTDEVLQEAETRFGSLTTAFQRYVQQTGREKPRSRPEYLFELLTLGVLWQVYAHHALKLAQIPRRAMIALVHLRQRGGRLKSVIDVVRGTLSTTFLFSRNGQHQTAAPALTPDHLGRLLNWLAATGDFRQEVERLDAWRAYFAGQPPEATHQTLAAICAFADWFEARSNAVLGAYTPQVEQFLVEEHPHYRRREDIIFCGRRRVEYHLNMVGTETLNRAYRGAFLAARRKVVFVPPCMRHPDSSCQARPTLLGARCAHCTPGCRIHQVTKLGEKHGFEVFILPDDLAGLSSKATSELDMRELGIVGVSCVLTNVTGGWQTKDMSLPAQGVLLDYCGCPWHWHKEGIPTDINVQQLLRTLGCAKARPRSIRSPERPEIALQA